MLMGKIRGWSEVYCWVTQRCTIRSSSLQCTQNVASGTRMVSFPGIALLTAKALLLSFAFYNNLALHVSDVDKAHQWRIDITELLLFSAGLLVESTWDGVCILKNGG